MRSLKMVEDLRGFQSDFSKRLEFQKTAYLIQEAGADLGYRFGWYLHGPYSSSYADDAYSLAALPKEYFDSVQESVDESVLRKIRDLLDSIPPTKNRSYWLELLSCVHFVKRHSYPKVNSKKQVVDYLLKLKGKRFSESDIYKAYDLLQNKSFLE